MNIHLHPHVALFWAAIILLKIVTTVVVTFRPWHHRSYFFTAYLIISSIRSILLFGASGLEMGWTYTWIYWGGNGLLHALSFATAYEFFRRLFWPYTVLPRTFLRPLLLTIAFISIATAVLGLSRESSEFFGLTVIDRSLTWWVCGIFWVVSAASDRFHIPWRTRDYGIGVGFLFAYSVDVFVTGMRSVVPGAFFPCLWIVSFCSEAVTLAVWIHHFMRKEAELVPPSPGEMRDLGRLLALFVGHKGSGTEDAGSE